MENLRGIAWMVLAMGTFTLADTFIVLSTDTLPPGQIVLMFSLFGTPLLAGYAKLKGVTLISPVFWTRPILFRNGAEIWGTMAVIYAFANLPFSLVSSVIQAGPLLVTLGAAVFLREAVGWRRWLAVCIGLGGVLLILEPWSAGAETGPLLLLAVVAVTGLSARDLATRFVPWDVPSLQVACYGLGSTFVAGLLLSAITGDLVWPGLRETGLMMAAAVFGAVAYLAITTAMRLGDIAVVTLFRYTRLIFAFTIAAVIFGERPGLFTWIGAAIVIATGIFTILRETRRR